MDSLVEIDSDRWMLVRFEDLVTDALRVYSEIRGFLGFENELSQDVENVLLSPVVNARKSYALPAYDSWSEAQRTHFHCFAGSVMDRLGYSYGR